MYLPASRYWRSSCRWMSSARLWIALRPCSIATVQYQAGRRDLLWVAQLQTDQLAVESNVIQLRSAQIANRIQLHLALGGSFEPGPATTMQEAN